MITHDVAVLYSSVTPYYI